MGVLGLLSKVILRLTLLGKRYIYRARGARGNALMMYTLVPPPSLSLPFFYKGLHNRFFVSKLMVQVLRRLGYNVYLHDYLDTRIDYNVHYDLFIGHNRYFADVAARLPASCLKILLTTGCSPEYDNRQLELRNADLKRRLGTDEDFFVPMQEVAFARLNCDVADRIFMIGSRFIMEQGWFPSAVGKAHLYNNISRIRPRIKTGRHRAFVYLSSNGQLRRGLDLLLQAFVGRKEKLFVCGPYANEPLYLKHFATELFHSENIVALGYVDQNSQSFIDLVGQTDFAILPSCSEGQSGALLNLMSYGLIPVATANTGFEDLPRLGVLIQECTVGAVQDGIDAANALSDDEIIRKRELIFATLKSDFSANSFEDRFVEVLKRGSE